MGFFDKLKQGLSKTKESFNEKINNVFKNFRKVDEDLLDELEEALIMSDVGMETSVKIIDNLRDKIKTEKIEDADLVKQALREQMQEILDSVDSDLKLETKPSVILFVGVNGVGKTTTIGKLASKYVKEGKKVILGAGDTFRAAAIEQLEEWANRAGAEIVKSTQGSDPGAVVFDTLVAAQSRGADIAIIDTAGRLHNKNNLMKELEKIHNIIKKKLGEQKYESILVIDGTTGQNALNQAKVFNEVTELTGFIITKLDGTAKGGIVFSISEEIKKPIKFIGVGEKIEDLREFNANEYIQAIFD